jgi:hypothetical protein
VANLHPVPENEISRFAATVLTVSDFLERRPEDATTLSYEEQQVIKEGLDYLKLVRNGQETVQSSGASIVARDESLSAYEETSEALYWARSASASPAGKKKLVSTSIEVLSALLNGKALNALDADAVAQTRDLFKTLEEYHFSGRSVHPTGAFDRSYYAME